MPTPRDRWRTARDTALWALHLAFIAAGIAAWLLGARMLAGID